MIPIKLTNDTWPPKDGEFCSSIVLYYDNWNDYDADTICRRVTSKVQPGSIVLFHNAALHTPEALPAILDCLINDGYTVVPISQLILDPPYTIDHTGRQFPAETVSTT